MDNCTTGNCGIKMSPGDTHQHNWMPAGIVKEYERQVRYLGTTLSSTRENSVAIQTCNCGDIKKTVVVYGEWDH